MIYKTKINMDISETAVEQAWIDLGKPCPALLLVTGSIEGILETSSVCDRLNEKSNRHGLYFHANSNTKFDTDYFEVQYSQDTWYSPGACG